MADDLPVGRTAWFEPASWAERRQLLVHLLHNVAKPVYLRAPAAAGKTRFLVQLAARVGQEFTLVRLAGGRASVDLVEAVERQLAGDSGGQALGSLLAAAPGPVLVAIDDADSLPAARSADLETLSRAGARLLLTGRGGPSWLTADDRVQLVDLPAFTPNETRDFALAVDNVLARPLVRDGGSDLFAATGGRPGLIVQRVAAAGAGAPARAAGGLLVGLGGGLLVALLGIVVWQQEAINTWLGQSGGGRAASTDDVRVVPPAGDPVPSVDAPEAAAPTPPDADEDLPVEPLVIARIEEAADLLEQDAIAANASLSDETPGAAGAAVPRAPVPDAPAEAAPPNTGEAPVPATAAASAAGVEAPQAVVPTGVESDAAATPAAAGPVPGEAAAAAPAPVGKVVPPETPVPPAPADAPPAPAVGEGPATAALPGLLGPEWLSAQAPERYTLQLVGARDPEAIRTFIARHRLSGELAVFEREMGGKPWYALLSGSFPDRDAALRARGGLPGPLRKDAWARPFADVRQYLGDGD
jgi:septal ring-binding cell division protein DamX